MWKCSFGWSLLSNKLPIIEWLIIDTDTDCVMIYCKPLTLNWNNRNNRNKYCHLLPMWANKRLEFKITYPNCNKWKEFWKWGVPNQGLGRGHLSLFQLSGVPLYTALVQWNFLPSTAEGRVYITFSQLRPILSCYIKKIVISNDRNLGTSKKPGTVLLMQNVNLGHTKVIEGDTKPPGGDNPWGLLFSRLLSCDSGMSESENPVPTFLVIGRNWIHTVHDFNGWYAVHVIFYMF